MPKRGPSQELWCVVRSVEPPVSSASLKWRLINTDGLQDITPGRSFDDARAGLSVGVRTANANGFRVDAIQEVEGQYLLLLTPVSDEIELGR
jgi:hypothetical protein